MKKLIICLIMLSFVFTNIASANEKLRIGVGVEYPPFSYHNEAGLLTGFDVEVANAICNELKQICSIRPILFGKTFEELEKGELEMLIASTSETPERKAIANFSKSYYYSKSVFLTVNDKKVVNSINDFKDKKIAVVEKTLHQMHLQKELKDNTKIVPVRTFIEGASLLKEGKVDYLHIDGLAAYTYLLSKDGVGISSVHEENIDLSIDLPAKIAITKKRPELLAKVNIALEKLKNTGDLDKIYRKFFPFSTY